MTKRVPEAVLTPIVDLQPHERNYRKHPPDQIAHLVQSIREHGFYRNVVVARDGTILAGHGVVEAATEAGIKEVPVVRLKIGPDDSKALKILAGDNELAHLAEVDDRILTELLKGIRDDDTDGLLGTGYDDQMLASLLYVTRPSSEIASHDAAAEWVGLPGFEAAGDRVVLVLSFETEQEREELIKQLSLVIAKKTRQTWSAWWPPRA